MTNSTFCSVCSPCLSIISSTDWGWLVVYRGGDFSWNIIRIRVIYSVQCICFHLFTYNTRVCVCARTVPSPLCLCLRCCSWLHLCLIVGFFKLAAEMWPQHVVCKGCVLHNWAATRILYTSFAVSYLLVTFGEDVSLCSLLSVSENDLSC